MKLFQFLVAVLLLVFMGSVYAEKPQQVIEQNLDTNGDIKVAIQNTDINPVPVIIKSLVDFPVAVEVKNTIDANITGSVEAEITGGEMDVNVTGGTVTVDSIPNIVIESMPPMLNGDHPALTSFSQNRGFNVTGGQIANMYFNDPGHKVCNPGDNKIIITTITGYVSGQMDTTTTLPLSVYISLPVLYYLSEGYRTDSFANRYMMVWNEKTNIIMDADPKIDLRIWQGPTFGSNTWSGRWSIFGYCFSP
jgi:hypothetical protein